MTDTGHLFVQIGNCARCGKDHSDGVRAKPFDIPFAPPESNGMVWTHWATCPTNGDPILIMQTPDSVEEPSS